MSAVGAARRTSPQRSSRPAPARRAARLTAVEARRRAVRRGATGGALAVVALVFAALGMWVSVITGQGRLDDLRVAITEQQEIHDRLVTEENQMQSPDEVLRTARDELQMTPPARSELITPAVEHIAPLADPAGA